MRKYFVAKRLYGWLSLIFLVIGIGIYLFFRQLNMLIFEWISKPALLEMFYMHLHPSVFTSIFLYNIPDMLWFLSGVFLLRFMWFHDKAWQKIYIRSFYGIVLVFETMQLLKNIPGTFDILDLLFMSIGALTEGLLYRILIERSF
jgi:glycopeptide antibiotics resistance protein